MASKSWLIGFAGFAAVVSATPLFAQDLSIETGNDFLEKCEADGSSLQWGICAGFLSGVVQLADVARSIDQSLSTCRDPEVTNGQMHDIFIAYLKAHPEHRHRSTASLIVVALRRAFCVK